MSYTASVVEHGLDAFSRPGVSVGKYRLVKRLAVGGMAEIFLAYTSSQHGFEKLVVLKRILPQHAENPDFVRMFLDEARLAATLDHPNIAHVYDAGEFEGSHYFTMEYVHGQSLLKVMRAITHARTPLPVEHAICMVIGACAGLHHAHEKIGLDGRPMGIVHRDVSPPNVIITYDGGVKVVDFGIAKAASARTSTAVGTLKGKIPYMSPEQCRSESLDRRSDIFSIGILLYELTVGRRLFQADTEIAIIARITKGGFTPPTAVHPQYPPELEAIVMRALQLLPDSRYATARQLQLELEDFAREYKLPVSSAKLAAFMERLFDDEARRWPTNPGIATTTQSQGVPSDVTPHRRAPSPDELQAFDTALEKLLNEDKVKVSDATSTIGVQPAKDSRPTPSVQPLEIDLDNLEVEPLNPAKFRKD